MLFRSRNEKTEAIEQTARADPHRLSWDFVKTDVFYERSSGSSRLQSIGNGSKSVLLGRHDINS
jgi:hypothetical protein